MKVAKKINSINTPESNSVLGNYYLVANDYDFEGNDANDVTSPNILETFMQADLLEYGVFRDTLMLLFIPIWNDLQLDERRICIKYYKYPPSITQLEFDSYYTSTEHENNWNSITRTTRDRVRIKRLFAAFSKISFHLTQAQVATIYLVTKQLCVDYYYGNIPNLVCWVTNTVSPLGPDYTSNGFAQMSGYSTSLRDEILDIIINGNYIYTI